LKEPLWCSNNVSQYQLSQLHTETVYHQQMEPLTWKSGKEGIQRGLEKCQDIRKILEKHMLWKISERFFVIFTF